MPRIVTSIHDPAALAATCQQLSLPPPTERTIQFDAEEVFGWVVYLPGVNFPIVCDTLSGLVAYHISDDVHGRYGHIVRFILRYYDVQTELWRAGCGPAQQQGH